MVQHHPHFRFVIIGGFFLALNAGFINAIGFLEFNLLVSHVTGALTKFGVSVAPAEGEALTVNGLTILCFLLGNILAGVVIGESQLQLGRRYGVTLMMHSAFLFFAIFFLDLRTHTAAYVLSLACGLQNGMATTYSGAVLRSSHMTGVMTDFGILISQLLTGRPAQMWRLPIFFSLLTGFVLGAVTAGFADQRWGIYSLMISAVGSGLLGAGYFIFRHFYWRPRHLSHH